MITITGIGDHLRPEWLIIFTGMRSRAVRQESSAPLVADLEVWLREQRAKLSRGNDLAKAMDYLLKR